MDFLKRISRRVRALVYRSAVERSLDDEIRLHLDLETEKHVRGGMARDEAERRARLDFGAVEVIKEAHRDGRGSRWLEEFVADGRFALRMLRHSPVLAAAAIITLAVGIGANTAIFSAVNAVILRPLPFADPGRLVMLWEENPEKGWHENISAPANYLDWKEQVRSFKDVAAYSPFVNSLTLTGAGDPRVLSDYAVTGNFFSVLGVRAQIGRVFRDAETWQSTTPGAILSDHLWRTQFAANPAVLGQMVQLNARPYEIIGVMPATFGFPAHDTDVWTTIGWNPAARNQVSFRRAHFLRTIARLTPGASFEAASADLQVVVKRLQHDYPETNRVMGAGMTRLQQFLVGDTRRPLLLLLTSVALLLLIACANVGNLILVQTAGRGREVALRLALGARRSRLLRQALTESLVISVLGGLSGFLLGWWGTHALITLQPSGMLPVEDIGVSWAVLGYVVAITTVSGLLFAIAPLLWHNQRGPGEVLKAGSPRAGVGPRALRWGHTLVVSEIALALLLTVGAGLLVRSFERLTRTAPGFDPQGVLAISLNVPGARYDSAEKISGYYARLMERVNALPGVMSSAVTNTMPLGGGVGWTSDFMAAGRPPDEYGTEVAHRSVSPEYFRTMRVPLEGGRLFTPDDRLDGDRVVIINESLAQGYFRGQDPIGQRITFDKVPDSNSVWRTIVGVVGDEHLTDLATKPQIEFITPEQQAPSTFMNLMVRVHGEPLSLVPSVRRAAAEIDPLIAFTSVQTMDNVRADSMARQRFLMVLLLAFASAGVVLAVVGVYGVMAHLARGRTREIGIRVALGASTTAVQWLVVREGLRLTAIGVVVGTVAALAGTRIMIGLLFGVTPADPLTFVAVPLLLGASALAATWIPAVRASRTDPAETLRIE